MHVTMHFMSEGMKDLWPVTHGRAGIKFVIHGKTIEVH